MTLGVLFWHCYDIHTPLCHAQLLRTYVFLLTEWYRTSIISNRGNLLVYLILTFSNIGKSYKTRNPNFLWLRCTYLFTLYVYSGTAPSKGQFQYYTRSMEKAEEILIWYDMLCFYIFYVKNKLISDKFQLKNAATCKVVAPHDQCQSGAEDINTSRYM